MVYRIMYTTIKEVHFFPEKIFTTILFFVVHRNLKFKKALKKKHPKNYILCEMNKEFVTELLVFLSNYFANLFVFNLNLVSKCMKMK